MPKTEYDVFNIIPQRNISANIQPLDDATKTKMIHDIIQNPKCQLDDFLVSQVDIRLLTVEYKYQRQSEHLERLVNNFDIRELGMATLSYRDGKLYVVNGLHRAIASILHGRTYLNSMIFLDNSIEDEANSFVRQDDCTTKIQTTERYKANLCAKDPDTLTVDKLMEKYKLDPLSSDSSSGRKPAITACMDCMHPGKHYNGYDCLDWVLSVCDELDWFETPNGTNNANLLALRAVYIQGVRKNSLNKYKKRLIKVAKDIPAKIIQVYGTTKSGKTDPRASMKCGMLRIAQGDVKRIDLLTTQENIKNK